MSLKFGYARISTPSQSLKYQIENLKQAECSEIFTDICSGAFSNRPGFLEMQKKLRRGDLVTITTLDRLGRSNKFLINLLEEWREREINLQILSQQIDTRTTHGKFIFDIMAALAEQERNIIRERIKKGLEGARARGKKGGRPKKLTLKEAKRMKIIYEEKNLSIQEISLMYNISKTTIYNYLTII